MPATVTDLAEYRVKRRLDRAADWANTLAACMNCGAEFLWQQRHEHNCQDQIT